MLQRRRYGLCKNKNINMFLFASQSGAVYDGQDMVTIRDVAAQAEVSPGTVSQVLSGRARVSPATRDAILKVVSELGYKRNGVGRPRLQRKAANVALVFPSASGVGYRQHPMGRQRIRDIREALTAAGDHFSLYIGDAEAGVAFRDAVESGDIDGVILTGIADTQDASLQWLSARDVPVVVLQRTPHAEAFSHVSLDDLGSGRCAADLLVKHGHRRLAYVRMSQTYDWARKRSEGFRQAGVAAGLDTPMIFEVAPGNVKESTLQVARALQEHHITGVFASSDGLAVSLIDCLEQLGADVPGELSIVGHDNVGYASQSGKVPSTIGYDATFFARAAVAMIRQLIDGEPSIAHLSTCVKTFCIEHDTTASAPAQK